MTKFYKEYLGGSYYFSKIFSYIISYVYNKDNFFKKRALKYDLFSNYKNSLLLKKKRNINVSKRKNIVIHFPTSEICYFYYHYFLYILIPQFTFLNNYEKKKIIDNIYLINNKINDSATTHIYNKIKAEDFNIIFCNTILPREKYDYINNLTLFLENKYFLDLYNKETNPNSEQINENKKQGSYNIRHNKGRKGNVHKNNRKNNLTFFNPNEINTFCSNFLYVSYISNNFFKQNRIGIVRRKNIFNSFIKYNTIIENINSKIHWINHYSFYEFYSKAYVSFVNYRMIILRNIVDAHFENLSKNINKKVCLKKNKHTNILRLFLKYKDVLLNSNIFFNFAKQIIYLDFKDAANLYIKYLEALEKTSVLSKKQNSTSLSLPINNGDKNYIDNICRYNKKMLIKEIQKCINIHIWNNNQKILFYSGLKNIKFRKIYN
ncbi:hypothetical protein YYG_02754 [Plasmodium vinckei petteri]|uniref:Uncharacterized protein n=1 Tax=Plasmodium vinckei petteri TaxID=138298 RepID=W7AL85_PLAVN|nr:hypothetical protein YYG_02754 [Plasmodium vinckei petteri]CAD2103056.1 conserved Plasmodium protein, unknown function [Plasmodium vinckei petteri]